MSQNQPVRYLYEHLLLFDSIFIDAYADLFVALLLAISQCCQIVYGPVDDMVENDESRERKRSEDDERRLNIMTDFIETQLSESEVRDAVDIVTTSMSRAKLSELIVKKGHDIEPTPG